MADWTLLQQTAWRAWRATLDFLFPKTTLERWLEKAAGNDISRRASPAPESPRGEALFAFHDPFVRKTIHLLKYRGNADAARIFATLIFERLFLDAADDVPFSPNTETLLVPIPLSTVRRRERGYNQSELITERLAALAAESGLPLLHRPGALLRVKHTASQTSTRSKAERLRNLAGAFRANPELVRGKTVILVDDVTTTGATFAEASRALRAAGAKRVRCYAIAH